MGVVAGYLVWTALWLVGNAVFFQSASDVIAAGQPFTAVGPLVALIGLSVACSIGAGRLAAAVAKARGRIAVITLAALLLVTGVIVQRSVWALMPAWYHLLFLGLIVPASLLGSGRFRTAAYR
jgi:hypothetical protein